MRIRITMSKSIPKMTARMNHPHHPSRRGFSMFLVAAALLQNLVITSGAASINEVSRPDASTAEQFWQSIDENKSTWTRSLEWMLDDDENNTADSESSPPQRLRSRSLQKAKKKDHADDYHWPAENTDRFRMLIRCKAEQQQDDCLSDLLLRQRSPSIQGIKVIHNLEAIHAISIEVDSQTRDALFSDDFELHRDFERSPMGVKEDPISQEQRRQLQEGQTIPWGLQMVQAMEVWDKFGVRGNGVKVCLLDTGVDAAHEEFQSLALDGYSGAEAVTPWSRDLRGHGTHILGTMGAADNDIGIVGIAPDIDVFVVKVFDDQRSFHGFSDGTSYSTDLIAAAQECKKAGANIISASLGGYSYNQFEDDFFRGLYENDKILTIAASGNGGSDRNVYPAAYDYVFSVGAIEESRQLAHFSTLNPSSTDILAPGVGILSTYVGDQYRQFSGTSMACPHVTGVAALMLSYIDTFQPNANVHDVFDILRSMSLKRADIAAGRAGTFGSIGIVDAYAAVEALANGLENGVNLKPDDPNQCQHEVRLELSTDSKGYETAYRLKRMSDGQNIWLEAPNTLDNNAKYSEKACLDDSADACFRFDVRDMGRDGIDDTDGGGIKLFYKGHELYHGGRFGGGGMLKFGKC